MNSQSQDTIHSIEPIAYGVSPTKAMAMLIRPLQKGEKSKFFSFVSILFIIEQY
ncbi:hypothetical protein [Gloeothece citriformis]|uniref:hypothetical protein n=1 Tax=Gloeothece citriformis TaxID=2546356 RepID=UPI0002E3AFBE|nr:hypothetical protein [Gloeothece citriformis]